VTSGFTENDNMVLRFHLKSSSTSGSAQHRVKSTCNSGAPPINVTVRPYDLSSVHFSLAGIEEDDNFAEEVYG